MSDAHALLGLAPGASATEIKKAFRRLAMRWHPDRNPDPAALEHFKALRAAYETLLAETDSPPPADAAANPAEPAQPDDTPRAATHAVDVTLDVLTAWSGGIEPVPIETIATCPDCAGSGETILRHSRLCPHCHGSGRLRRGTGLSPCPDCNGRGFVTRQACPACAGRGQVETRRAVECELPAGLGEGDTLRVPGAGPEGADLLLTIHLGEHPLYRVTGRDIHLERPCSAWLFLAGGDAAIPLPDGVRQLRIDVGPPEVRILRVAGAGLPARAPHPGGDLYVRLVPVFPPAPDAIMREFAARLEAHCAAARPLHQPALAAWEARWLDSPDLAAP